jgi:tripartite-type tricarboxylate transporter receptor subunit TctC
LREVPTVAESGLAGFEANYWYALLMPADAATAVVDRVNADVAKAVNAAETRERLLRHGIEARSSTSAELAAIVQSEIARWRKVITSATAARL